MNDPWVATQWQELCGRVKQTAESRAAQVRSSADRIRDDAEQFCGQSPPDRYPELLGCTRSAAQLAISWQQLAGESNDLPESSETSSKPVRAEQRESNQESESDVDETLDESFPASDPPSWTSTAI